MVHQGDSNDQPTHIICLTSDLFFYQWVENEKIISQIVGISEVCNQNGDRVSQNENNCDICSIRLTMGFIQLSMKNMRLGQNTQNPK